MLLRKTDSKKTDGINKSLLNIIRRFTPLESDIIIGNIIPYVNATFSSYGYMPGANLSGRKSQFKNMVIKEAYFRGIILKGASFNRVVFYKCNFENVAFDYTRMYETTFYKCEGIESIHDGDYSDKEWEKIFDDRLLKWEKQEEEIRTATLIANKAKAERIAKRAIWQAERIAYNNSVPGLRERMHKVYWDIKYYYHDKLLIRYGYLPVQYDHKNPEPFDIWREKVYDFELAVDLIRDRIRRRKALLTIQRFARNYVIDPKK
jgi:hypothetical protein